MAQKMDLMMEMVLDLFHRVKAPDTQQRDWQLPHLHVHPNPMLKEGGAGAIIMIPTPDPDLSDAVRRSVVQRLQQLPISEETTSDKGSMSEEAQQTTRWCRPLKLGMNHTGCP